MYWLHGTKKLRPRISGNHRKPEGCRARRQADVLWKRARIKETHGDSYPIKMKDSYLLLTTKVEKDHAGNYWVRRRVCYWPLKILDPIIPIVGDEVQAPRHAGHTLLLELLNLQSIFLLIWCWSFLVSQVLCNGIRRKCEHHNWLTTSLNIMLLILST